MSTTKTSHLSFWRRITVAGNLTLGTALIFAGAGCGQPESDQPKQDDGQRMQAGGGYYNNGGGYYNNGGGYYNNGGGYYNNGGAFGPTDGETFYSSGGGIPNGGGSELFGFPNGGHQSGLGWNGGTGSNQQYYGIGWNQTGAGVGYWTGVAWGGNVSSQQVCAATGSNTWGVLSTGYDNACTTLHNAINGTDVNGDESINYVDQLIRLNALGHWVACACPNSVSIPFVDITPRGGAPSQMTLNGNFGLAPTWCGSSTTTAVPNSEMQLVSACMLALQNTSGRHYPISLRSLAMNTPIQQNDLFLNTEQVAYYWGNLWKDEHVDFDWTTCNYQNPPNPQYPNYSTSWSASYDPNCWDSGDQGGPWYNKERFSCQGPGTALNATDHVLADQSAFGRDCEVSTCGGGVEWLGLCSSQTKTLANSDNGSYYQHNVNGVNYFETVPQTITPVGNAPGALTSYKGLDSNSNNVLNWVTIRGDWYQGVEVWVPPSIPVEDPLSGPQAQLSVQGWPVANPWQVGLGWTQVDWGTAPLPSSQSADCTNAAGTPGQFLCQGVANLFGTGSYRKLLGLTTGQWVTINYTGYHGAGNANNVWGDASTPVTLAIRYQRTGCLNDGQCDPLKGCIGTSETDCTSGVQNGDFSCQGSAVQNSNACAVYNSNWTPGKIEMYVMNSVSSSPNWAYAQGNSAPYKNGFVTTGLSDAAYNTAYFYPIYPQNSFNTISGMPISKPSSDLHADTLRVALTGSTSSTSISPQIDAAYFTPAMPTSDMNCTTSAGCWVYLGPNQWVSLSAGNQQMINLGAPLFYVSPTLPAGTYTFQLKNVMGDLDLYVAQNQMVSTSAWNCRPYLGRNQDETCTMTLTSPGYFSVMVNGYANQICDSTSTHGCTCPNYVSGCAATATVVGHN